MSERTCWIETLTYDELDDEGKGAYDGLRREDGTIHNLYRPYSLWTAPLASADQLYKDILHHPSGPFTMAEREFLATQVAILNGCRYAESHHGENFRLFWGDRAQAERMLEALRGRDHHGGALSPRLAVLADYGAKLTLTPEAMTEADLETLRDAGISEQEILQLNQITANFAYWVRTINGLGISMGDERVGLSPEKVAALQQACDGKGS